MTELRPTLRRSRRFSGLPLLAAMTAVVVIGIAGAAAFQAPTTPPAPTTTAPPATTSVSIWDLFKGSFDFFTVLLVAGSLAAWTIIIMCFIEIRARVINPPESEEVIRRLARAGSWSELREFVSGDDAFVSRVVRSGMAQSGDDKDAVREAAELSASEETARWFRKIEPLNVLGNLGPLLGLAGTVWGMVLAFAELGQAGGQATPANLSAGVSKALFHTLLGLLLAVPALTVFGFYRGLIDRICTRALVVSAELVEMLPAAASLRRGDTIPNSQARPGVAPAAAPRPMPKA